MGDNERPCRGVNGPCWRIDCDFCTSVMRAPSQHEVYQERINDPEKSWPIPRPHDNESVGFTGPGLDGAVVKPSPVPVVVEPAPVRYGFTGGNVA